MERLTHYIYTDSTGFIITVDDQEEANIELARYENLGVEPGDLGFMLEDYKAMKEAEEQGRFIIFPCAVGDHLWEVYTYYPYYNKPPVVREIVVESLDNMRKSEVDQEIIQMVFASSEGYGTVYIDLDQLGKTLFFTRKEAEAKLKELEDCDGTINKTH